MEYLVRSINAARNHNSDRSEFTRQLQIMINEHAEEGWELHGVEQVSTWVKGNSACFNQKQGYFETINLVIFKK